MTDCATTDPRLVRASDQDRELAIADLGQAVQVGRLTTTEYTARSAAALASSTLGELWGLTHDIQRGAATIYGSEVAQPVPAVGFTPAPSPYPMPAYIPPQWRYVPPAAKPTQRTNPIAVVAFAVSLVGLALCTQFVGSVLGAGLGVIALWQVRDDKADVAGHNLATAAVAIAAASVLLGINVVLHTLHTVR